jgi:hypothetical protein
LFQGVVREVARRRLDITKPFTEQNEEALNETYQEVCKVGGFAWANTDLTADRDKFS